MQSKEAFKRLVYALWMSHMTCACIAVRKAALTCHWPGHLRPGNNGRGQPVMQNGPYFQMDEFKSETEQEDGSYPCVLMAGTDTVLRNSMTRS